MKYALIIPDGCADEPQASLGGLTPLQAARTPHMDAIAAAGIVGRADTVPPAMTAGSDVGTMSLFGYDPLQFHTGRAPIEAAAQGIELADGDWAVRCNLVTVLGGLMRSFTAGQIASDDGRELLQLLQRELCGSEHWKFHPGVSYRNLLIHRSRGQAAPFDDGTHTVPPHDITDQPIEPHLPSGRGAETLREFMDGSARLFADCAVNRRRAARGEAPCSQVWLWGQGRRPALVPFKSRFGVQGAVITAVDLLRGMGRLLDWPVIDVPGATGYTDTDYAAKGRYAVQTLASVDLIVVHVEATDEASHEGDASAKVAALERIDADIVAPVHEHLQSRGDYRILVSPDHPTLLRTKTHSHGEVPFAICGTDIEPDVITTYDEVAAADSTIAVKGHELMPLFIPRQVDEAQ